MGVPFRRAEEMIEEAAAVLFDADPQVRSVGICRQGSAFGYRAVRNSALIVPFRSSEPPIREIHQIPVVYKNTPGEVESLLVVADSGPSSPEAASVIAEVKQCRPLVAGVQIQNLDDDIRQGRLQNGLMTVGTLGCFVHLESGSPAFISNNHVIAGENRGRRGDDRILQPSGGPSSSSDQIGILHNFVDLQISPSEAGQRTALFNEVDAGSVQLDNEVRFTQGYLPFRNLIAPNGTARARIGDRVFKVGRSTGLTFGEVVEAGTIVGPVHYAPGPCWFRRSLVIEGIDGTLFSDKGDSGAAIVRENGEVVGLLYAGNGQQTYACPIETVLRELRCSLA